MRYLLLSSVLVLTACTQSGQGPAADSLSELDKSRLDVDIIIARAANHNAQSLDHLAQIKKLSYPAQAIDVPERDVPAELHRKVQVLYSEATPMMEMIHKLTKEAGYTLNVFGKPPHIAPIMVTFPTSAMSLNDAFRHVHLQAGRRAAIKVDAKRSVVEVWYQNYD